MMTLVTGSPGLGKTSLVVAKLDKTEKNNKINLKKNRKYFELNLEIFKGFEDEFKYRDVEIGSGNLLKRDIEILSDDYFDIFLEDFDDLRPDDYFAKSVIYNQICTRIANDNNIVKFYHLLPVRTIYTNINNLKIDYVRSLELLHIESKGIDWRIAPDGSIIVIDEIQLVEPYKDVKIKTNPIIQDLTVHRHRGFDFYIITQSTNYINLNMRDLFWEHLHVSKPFGLATKVYHYGGFRSSPDVRSSKRTAENVTSFNPPQRIFDLYTSTTINTARKRIPWKMVFIFGSALLFGFSLMFYGFFGSRKSSLFNKEKAQEQAKKSVTDVSEFPLDDKQKQISEEQQKQDDELARLKKEIEREKILLEYNELLIQKNTQLMNAERLDYSYKSELSDDNIKVAGVMVMNGECQAYNKFGDNLRMSNADCLNYQNGKIIKARYGNNDYSMNSEIVPSSLQQN